MSLLSKVFFKETLPLAGLATVVSAVAVGSFAKNDRDTLRIDNAHLEMVIADQQEKIDTCAIGAFAGVKSPAAKPGDGAPCECPAAKPVDCPPPKEAKCTDGADNQGDLVSANLRTCTDSAKSVGILATAARQNCANARVIHGIIDDAKVACADVLDSAAGPGMKKTAEDAISSLEKSHKNYFITPPACGLK